MGCQLQTSVAPFCQLGATRLVRSVPYCTQEFNPRVLRPIAWRAVCVRRSPRACFAVIRRANEIDRIAGRRFLCGGCAGRCSDLEPQGYRRATPGRGNAVESADLPALMPFAPADPLQTGCRRSNSAAERRRPPRLVGETVLRHRVAVIRNLTLPAVGRATANCLSFDFRVAAAISRLTRTSSVRVEAARAGGSCCAEGFALPSSCASSAPRGRHGPNFSSAWTRLRRSRRSTARTGCCRCLPGITSDSSDSVGWQTDGVALGFSLPAVVRRDQAVAVAQIAPA
jgi:hypothetical protein